MFYIWWTLVRRPQTDSVSGIIFFQALATPRSTVEPAVLRGEDCSFCLWTNKVFIHDTPGCSLVGFRDSFWKMDDTRGTNFTVASKAGKPKTVGPNYMMQISDFIPTQKLKRASAIYLFWPEWLSTGRGVHWYWAKASLAEHKTLYTNAVTIRDAHVTLHVHKAPQNQCRCTRAPRTTCFSPKDCNCNTNMVVNANLIYDLF